MSAVFLYQAIPHSKVKLDHNLAIFMRTSLILLIPIYRMIYAALLSVTPIIPHRSPLSPPSHLHNIRIFTQDLTVCPLDGVHLTSSWAAISVTASLIMHGDNVFSAPSFQHIKALYGCNITCIINMSPL